MKKYYLVTLTDHIFNVTAILRAGSFANLWDEYSKRKDFIDLNTASNKLEAVKKAKGLL